MCYCNPDWFCNWGFAPNLNCFFVLTQKSNQKKSRLCPLRSKRTCLDNWLKGGGTKRVWKYSSKWSSSGRWVPWERTDIHLINTDIFECNSGRFLTTLRFVRNDGPTVKWGGRRIGGEAANPSDFFHVKRHVIPTNGRNLFLLLLFVH